DQHAHVGGACQQGQENHRVEREFHGRDAAVRPRREHAAGPPRERAERRGGAPGGHWTSVILLPELPEPPVPPVVQVVPTALPPLSVISEPTICIQSPLVVSPTEAAPLITIGPFGK